jgi:hypothetical protein
MALANAPADDEAIELRQHPVEHEEIWALAVDGLDRGGAVVGLDDAIPLIFEMPSDQVVQRTLVFDDQDGGHGAATPVEPVSGLAIRGLGPAETPAPDRGCSIDMVSRDRGGPIIDRSQKCERRTPVAARGCHTGLATFTGL